MIRLLAVLRPWHLTLAIVVERGWIAKREDYFPPKGDRRVIGGVTSPNGLRAIAAERARLSLRRFAAIEMPP